MFLFLQYNGEFPRVRGGWLSTLFIDPTERQVKELS